MTVHAYSVRQDGDHWAVFLNGAVLGSGMSLDRARRAASVAARMSINRGFPIVQEPVEACCSLNPAIKVEIASGREA
jgi:hypothetical protein